MDGTQRGARPLYRRLPHGPHGMAREEVARNQRARLYGGMIESIAEHGYRGTTVANVIALAGVSRRAFYELFSSKEDCFVATYDIVVARSRKRVLEAWGRERGWANRMHASCKVFLEDIACDPKGAHLVLIDSLGLGAKARERMHLAGACYERLTVAAFRACPASEQLPAIAGRATVGGVRHVVFNRLRERRWGELRTLADEVLDWIEAYRSPASTRLRVFSLPGPPQIPVEPVGFLEGEDRRTRALGAIVHLTLDEGYATTTDPQLAQFACMSTEAFHKQFPGKEACFIAVLEEIAREATEAVEISVADAYSWPERAYLAVRAFIEHIVARPALLRVAFVDLFEVGPGVIDCMTRPVERLIALITEGAPEPRRAPAVMHELLTGALWDIISAYAYSDRLRSLLRMIDVIAFLALAPYVGPRVAIDTIEQCRVGSRRCVRVA
jgi:AcrR family transcriptional regulator